MADFTLHASTTLEEPLLRLRETKHRSEKPFAIMARSLEAAKQFAEVNQERAGIVNFADAPDCAAKQGRRLQSFPIGCASPA